MRRRQEDPDRTIVDRSPVPPPRRTRAPSPPPRATSNIIPFTPRAPTVKPTARPVSPATLASGWDRNAVPPRPQIKVPSTVAPVASGAAAASSAAAAVAPLHLEPEAATVPSPAFVPAPPPAAPVVATTPHTSHAPATQPANANAHDPWAIYHQLGLGPSTRPARNLAPETAKFLVNTYRGLGFAILSIIVIVLVGYIATSAFYFVSDSWIQPMRVARTDERVLALQAQLAEQENVRDRVAAELNHADRYIAVQQAYQAEFAQAIRADLTGRRAALGRVRDLAKGYAGARDRVRRSNQAFAAASQRKMAEEYAAGLIDRGDMLSGKFQLAQITSSNMTLAERQAEYEDRAAALQAEAEALDAILDEKGGSAALSYDVLKIKQEYEMSRLEAQKAIETRTALQASLARQDAVVEGLKQSPYLRAASGDDNVAFVPYGNMEDVKPGVGLYGCAAEMLFCRKVGKVVEVLEGEVQFKHPHREKVLRGQMIVVELKDRSAAEDDVLFVGGAPLLL